MIIPVHNRTTYLDEVLSSVAEQTYGHYEVILINDGSSAEVGPVLLALCEQYPFAQMLELDQHHGVSHARNRGIGEASGTYVLFLDDDDRLAPEMLERCLERLKADRTTDVVIAGAEVFADGPSTRAFRRQKAIFEHTKKRYGTKLPSHWSYFLIYSPPIHAMLFKRSVFETAAFPEDLEYGEDRFLWLKLKRSGVSFQKLEYTGAFYRLKADRGSVKLKRKQQVVFFETLLASGLMETGEEKNYVFTCLWLLSLKSLSIGKVIAYFLKGVRSPFGFTKNLIFLLKFRR